MDAGKSQLEERLTTGPFSFLRNPLYQLIAQLNLFTFGILFVVPTSCYVNIQMKKTKQGNLLPLYKRALVHGIYHLFLVRMVAPQKHAGDG